MARQRRNVNRPPTDREELVNPDQGKEDSSEYFEAPTMLASAYCFMGILISIQLTTMYTPMNINTAVIVLFLMHLLQAMVGVSIGAYLGFSGSCILKWFLSILFHGWVSLKILIDRLYNVEASTKDFDTKINYANIN